MYTEKEIFEKLEQSSDSNEKWSLIAHLITHSILQNPLESTSREEYFEALIFASFFIVQKIPKEHNEERIKIQTVLTMNVYEYCSDIQIPSGDCIRYTIDEIAEDPFSFIFNRYKTIVSEINMMTQKPEYLIPILIHNLYLFPAKVDIISTDEASKKIDFIELLKQSSKFKIKYKIFLEYLDNIFSTLLKNN